MNKMKKSVLVLLALILTCSLFVQGCKKDEPAAKSRTKGLKEKIENKTDAYLTDMMDSKDGLKDNKSIKKYLINWADAKGIRVKEDDGIVVMNVDSSLEYKDASPTVIVCPYDEEYLAGCINPLVMSMYLVKNNEETERMTALFYSEKGHDLKQAEKIKKKYFPKGCKVICLNGDEFAIVSDGTGGASEYEFTRKFESTAPTNQKAYEITISNISSCQIDNKINQKINPIVELNTLLTALKKAMVDFEIASFRGGKTNMLYPGMARVVITVDEDRAPLFESRIAARIESFDKRKKAADELAVYEYKEVPLPRRVINKKGSGALAGFIYTLLEDEYHRDEDTDELLAACDVSYIRTSSKGKVRIGSTAYSLDENKLLEIDDAEETLCDLSGFKYKKIGNIPSWSDREDTDLKSRFKKAYKKYTGKDLVIQPSITPSSASYINKIAKDKEIISVTVSKNTLRDLTGTVMRYLISSKDKDEDK